jgi:hypothetical protein
MKFATIRLPLAAFFHCTQQLEFLAVRKASEATAVFEFLDPECRGEDLEIAFEQGRALVDARAFASSERFLKNKMYRVLHREDR